MQSQWIFSSTFLPYTGEPIEFMLEEREQPIHGTFADGLFHSRWADYAADRVASWRGADRDPSAVAPIAIPKLVQAGAFATTMKRLANVLSGRSNVTPIKPPRSHARAIAILAIAVVQ